MEPLSLLGGGVLLGITAFLLSRRREKLRNIPVMSGYGEDQERALMEGALKVSLLIFNMSRRLPLKRSYPPQYPTTPFIVGSQRPFVIIPPCCYDDFKSVPQTKATFWEIQKKEMGADFTGIFQHNVQVDQALRSDLNRNLASTLKQVQDKISWVFQKELGSPQDWKAYRVHEVVVLIVARLVAGVFVGPRFTRDDEWTNLSLRIAVDLVLARDAIKRWPAFMQPIIGSFLPEIKAVNQQISRMAEMLKPVISESVLNLDAPAKLLSDEEKLNLEAIDEGNEGSFMSWILKRLKTTDPEILARAQISRK